jgi:hypothetical protein
LDEDELRRALATALVLASVAWPLAWRVHGYAVWPHVVIPLGAALAHAARGARITRIVRGQHRIVCGSDGHRLLTSTASSRAREDGGRLSPPSILTGEAGYLRGGAESPYDRLRCFC